jgi:hypothetical protein
VVAKVVSKIGGLFMNLVEIVDLIVDKGPLQEVSVLFFQGMHFFYDSGGHPQKVRVLIR